MIKYIGSKRRLVPLIERVASRLPARSACDLFAGTTRVGQALRGNGLRVVSNDTASYSEALALAYVVADGGLDRERLRRLLAHLDGLAGVRGYVTETFCERSRYFTPANGMRIDAIRAEIDALARDVVEHGALLTSLLEAADRVDSTCGLQMAYLKRFAPRALEPVRLREPEAVAGPRGSALRLDANELAPQLDVDLAYVDPPYNQHSYLGNYHVWETLARNDAPACYGVACKRADVRERRSAYNSRRLAWGALEALVRDIAAPWLIVSLGDEGFHDPADVLALLRSRGYVAARAIDVRRYVGAQIGIHDRRGARVGTVSHLRNRELLFVVGPDRGRVARAFDGVAGATDPFAAGCAA